MVKKFSHPSVDDLNIDSILSALSDPDRRHMLSRMMDCKISKEGMNCSEACEDKLPPSTISFHTRVLREAGLIYSEKKGVSVINTARKDDIDKRFPGLIHAIFQHHKPAKKGNKNDRFK